MSPNDLNFSELEKWLDEHRVTEVECLVPDLTGVARGKILPREKFTEDRGMRLPAQVVHDCYTPGGELVRYAPRSVLRRVIELCEGRGWSSVVAPEHLLPHV